MYKESEIITKTSQFVEQLMGENLSEDFPYHNLQHTQEVVEASIEIGEKSELDEEQQEIVVLAAWLHDTGYRTNQDDHEQESKKIARKFLSENNYPAEKVEAVVNAIEATRIPQNPKNIMEEVLCDADLYHLSTNQFNAKSDLLKGERESLGNENIEKGQWTDETLTFIKRHTYFTNYGKYVLEPGKAKNLKKLKKKKKKADKKEAKDEKSEKYVEKLQNEVIKLKNKLDKEKEIRPTRGIETMFRITSRNHLTLSGMADNKANIMISVNSIILSIILTVLFRKFTEFPNLLIPALVLTVTSLTIIIFSILATRPNVSSGTFTEENIRNKETNLLFFGNFHRVPIDNYLWGMKEMMKDADYLYGSMIKDIYYLGVVLGKKYRMLRASYTVFMYGLVVSIILFVLSQIYPSAFIWGNLG